ncbi:MAG: hypothetical protein V4648_01795 [Bacteroidota bacterium]
MENNPTQIEQLIEKAEVYSRTSLKLLKYNAIFKSADIASNLAVKLAIAVTVVMFSLFISIGLALWIGKELGETFYGFFVVASVYLLIGIVIYLLRDNWIKNPVSNFIISRLQKK